MHGKWSRWGLRRHEVRHLAKSNRRSFVPFGFAQGSQNDRLWWECGVCRAAWESVEIE
jgi:hypothetical protein